MLPPQLRAQSRGQPARRIYLSDPTFKRKEISDLGSFNAKKVEKSLPSPQHNAEEISTGLVSRLCVDEEVELGGEQGTDYFDGPFEELKEESPKTARPLASPVGQKKPQGPKRVS